MAPKVKICGVTRAEDAELAADLGAELIGLNFWSAGARYLEPAAARAVADAVRGRAEVVGVFVDASEETIREVDDRVRLDRIQFHGRETPERLAPFGERAIKAFRGRPTAGAAARFTDAWAWLVDSDAGEVPGGSGLEWDWDVDGLGDGRRVLVAGGIRPATARRAAASGAWGLDVCSGVESRPGVKDPAALTSLFAALGSPEAVRV